MIPVMLLHLSNLINMWTMGLYSFAITDQFCPAVAVFAENVSLITLHKFGTILFLLDLDRTLFIPCLCKMLLDKILGKIIQIWWLLHIFYSTKWKLFTRTVFVYWKIYIGPQISSINLQIRNSLYIGDYGILEMLTSQVTPQHTS